jgi:2-dehydro-3-deoxy-D-arabinonate dehydratase
MRRMGRTIEGWSLATDDGWKALRHPLHEVLAGAPLETTGPASTTPGELLAPVDHQEVWAAGVTYQRSLQARAEESAEPDVYERVYQASRPEIFFKSTPERVRGPGQAGCIRSDSAWNVPEPELGLVLAADGSVFGYTIGDDLSSRSIEGENPLYLPQAKVYEGACVVGPWIVPVGDVGGPFDVRLEVHRGGDVAFSGTTSTAKMYRTLDDLVDWLGRGLRFPAGAVLLTGTGIVPDDSFTLAGGDRVEITVDPLGTLSHPVEVLDCG